MNSKTGPKLRIIHGQPSWRIASNEVEAFVTQLGGQVGPATFERSGRKLRPYSVAPWAEEEVKLIPILKALRGDFFCLPFGGNAKLYRGEKHPVHGETANGRWRFEELEGGPDQTCLHLSLATQIRPGRVDKRISLRKDQNAIYSEHTISSMSGPMNFGHHAMLKFPDAPDSGRISTSPFVYGQVFPGVFERPEEGGYSALRPGALFESLEKVPTSSGEPTDLTRYPARRGFEDLVMIVSDDTAEFAWTAVTFPRERYLWFGLKDPRVLRETVFWLSNGGRHYPPWSGRHINVIGLEEVTSCFHFGLAESVAKNPISERGFPTCVKLDPKRALTVRYIMGVAPIPPGFDQVVSVRRVKQGELEFASSKGKRAAARVDVSFLGGSTS